MHAFGGASTVLFSSAVFGSNLSVCQLKMFTPGPKLLQHPDKANSASFAQLIQILCLSEHTMAGSLSLSSLGAQTPKAHAGRDCSTCRYNEAPQEDARLRPMVSICILTVIATSGIDLLPRMPGICISTKILCEFGKAAEYLPSCSMHASGPHCQHHAARMLLQLLVSSMQLDRGQICLKLYHSDWLMHNML